MSETSNMVVRTVEELIAAHADSLTQQQDGAEDAFYADLVESGLPLTLVPEESGGVGFDFEVAAAIARAWGNHAAPVPIVEILMANQVVAAAERPDLIDKVTLVSGTALFHGRVGKGLVAPWFPGVAYVGALSGDASGDAVMTLIDAKGLNTVCDLSGAVFLEMGETQITDGEPLKLAGPVREIEARAAILTASAALGCMERVGATVNEYAKTRVQFGRPLTAFQAVQHMIAEIHSETALTQGAVDQAVTGVDGISATNVEWLIAKIQASRASGTVAAHAHQVLGAIGFTEEHELHFYTKRLWSWRDRWGAQADCEAALGEMACQAGHAGLWKSIAASNFATKDQTYG